MSQKCLIPPSDTSPLLGVQVKGPRPSNLSFSCETMVPSNYRSYVSLPSLSYSILNSSKLRLIRQTCLTCFGLLMLAELQGLPLTHTTSKSARLRPLFWPHRCLLYSSHFLKVILKPSILHSAFHELDPMTVPYFLCFAKSICFIPHISKTCLKMFALLRSVPWLSPLPFLIITNLMFLLASM